MARKRKEEPSRAKSDSLSFPLNRVILIQLQHHFCWPLGQCVTRQPPELADVWDCSPFSVFFQSRAAFLPPPPAHNNWGCLRSRCQPLFFYLYTRHVMLT